ncbi:MAG TPA: TIGR03435 family protein [Vicinamibacterales bacterium]|nr:TIGR03435 family protein [Vicinamibacterales bacterium]
MRHAAIAGLLLMLAAPAIAQSSAPATFDVASIKENKTDTNRVSMNVLPGGRWVATNVSLATLIAGAYGDNIPLPPNRVVLPAEWTGSGPYATAPRFDIEAKAGRDFKAGEFLPAARRLLEERFKLVIHHEMRELPTYVLVMDRADRRLGPRLKPSNLDCTDPKVNTAKNDDGTSKCGFRGRAGSATGTHTIGVLAGFLTNVVADHRTVVNRTELLGTYDIGIDWAPETPVGGDTPAPPADANATSIFTAVREQLGLRLEPGKQQVDVLVVDRAEHPTEN